jgi:hypothetical protein
MKKNAGSPPDPGNRKRILWLLIFLYIVLSVFLFDPKPFVGGDNARYINLARSMLLGKGYRDISHPDEPRYTLYPPGFPALLLPVIAVFGSNILILKIIPMLCGLGAFIFFIFIVQILFPKTWIYPAVTALCSPILLLNGHWLLSEIPFVCFSLGGLYFFYQYQKDKRTISAILFTFFSIYAFLIRSAGITLIAAIALFLMVSKNYKMLIIFLAVFLALFVAWTLRNSSIPGTNTYDYWFLKKNPYLDESPRIGFNDFINRIIFNFKTYTLSIFPSSILSSISSPVLLAISGIALTALVISGVVRRLKAFTFLDWYLIFSLVIIITWTETWTSERFLLPIIPVLFIYIFFGLSWISEKLKSKSLIPVITGLMLFVNLITTVKLSATAVFDNVQYLRGDRYAGYSPDWRRYFETIDWTKKNIPGNQVIMARKPEFVFLFSGHKSFVYPYSTDPDKMRASIDQADYILLDNFYWTGTTRRYLLPALNAEPDKYEIVYRSRPPEFYVLKVKSH